MTLVFSYYFGHPCQFLFHRMLCIRDWYNGPQVDSISVPLNKKVLDLSGRLDHDICSHLIDACDGGYRTNEGGTLTPTPSLSRQCSLRPLDLTCLTLLPAENVYESAAKLLFLAVKWARSIPSFLQVYNNTKETETSSLITVVSVLGVVLNIII